MKPDRKALYHVAGGALSSLVGGTFLLALITLGGGSSGCGVDCGGAELSVDYDRGVAQAQTDNAREYQEGLNAGEALTEADGRTAGFESGRIAGHNQTYQTAYNTAFDDEYAPAYRTGYNDTGVDLAGRLDGYDDGLRAGSNDGSSDGFYDGYDVGYEDGYDDGYDDWYETGYLDGLDSSGSADSSEEDRNTCFQRGYTNTYTSGEFNRGINARRNCAADNPLRNNAWCTGYASSYPEGVTLGRSQGTTGGALDGERDGRSQGRANGERDNYDEAYSSAYTPAYNSFYNSSYDDAFDDGYSVGYNDGYDDGADDGYDDGFDDAGYDLYGARASVTERSTHSSENFLRASVELNVESVLQLLRSKRITRESVSDVRDQLWSASALRAFEHARLSRETLRLDARIEQASKYPESWRAQLSAMDSH